MGLVCLNYLENDSTLGVIFDHDIVGDCVQGTIAGERNHGNTVANRNATDFERVKYSQRL